MTDKIEWKDSGRYGRYTKARVGHLFAYIKCSGVLYASMSEPETFEWFIAPDDEDKNYRRALATGRGEKTLDDAKHRVKAALHEILVRLSTDIGRL